MRRLHRWATILVGAQILVWVTTGFAFSWFDFGAVRGTRDRAPAPRILPDAVRIAPAEAIARAGLAATQLELVPLLDGAVYVVAPPAGDPVMIDASTGLRRAPLSAEEAKAVARAAFVGTPAVSRAELLARADDLAGPVWRVRLADARATDVFVSARSGRVVAWRNDTWRWFDRLWSLHVLGWVSRDDPAHLPMRIVAALALTVAITGVALLVSTLRRRKIVTA
jgi:hypothetical protein